MKSGLALFRSVRTLTPTAAVFLAFAAALAQTLRANGKNDRAFYSALAQAPERARHERDPFDDNAGTLAAGRKLYGQYCASCHGDDGRGRGRAPSLLAPQVQQSTPGALYWVLSNGVVRRGMPDWSKLPEPMRWQIVRFVKSLRAPQSKSMAATPR